MINRWRQYTFMEAQLNLALACYLGFKFSILCNYVYDWMLITVMIFGVIRIIIMLYCDYYLLF